MAVSTIGSITIPRPREHGFLVRFLETIIAAQSRRAERIVKAHLSTLDDESLRRLGYSREDVRGSGSYASYL